MLTADYVVGLVDGEGSFAVHLNRSQRRRAKVEPRFCLKLKADDRLILDELRDFFGCGKVYVQRNRRPNHCLCYRFEVSNRAELLERIIPFFRQHPLKFPSKRRDFALFDAVLGLVAREAHRTSEGLETIEQLAAKMHLGSLDALDALVQWERGIEFNDLNHRPSSHEREGHPKSPLPAPKMKLLIGTKS
jgi:hypothetical protein